MKREEENKLNVSEMQCLRIMCMVYKVEEVEDRDGKRERLGVREKISKRVDRKVLKWFGNVERMGDERLNKKVYNSEVGGERGVGKPCFRWIDEVKEACED